MGIAVVITLYVPCVHTETDHADTVECSPGTAAQIRFLEGNRCGQAVKPVIRVFQCSCGEIALTLKS